MSDRNFDILGLSKKEVKVNCILDSNDLDEEDKINTPLLINRKTKISRTAIYNILEVLRKRGLMTQNVN